MKKNLALFAIFALGLSATWLAAEEHYRVMSGDNLGEIGKKFSVPYQDIMAANNLESTTIYVGQELVIPAKNQVVAGSHSYPQANQTRISAPIKPPRPQPDYNQNRHSPELTSVQRPPVKNSRGTEHQCNVHYRGSSYRVERGDSVRSISRKFGVAFWDLRHENDLWLTKLSPGMILKIPTRPSTIGVAF